MKKLFFFVVACVFATTASAQFVNSGSSKVSSGNSISAMSTDDYNRIYVGYNPTKINWEHYQSELEEEFPLTQSLTFGYLHASSLANSFPLFLEYGANLQYSFGKEKEDGYEWSLGVYSVNVPVNLAFKFQFNDISLTPYLGVNFRVNAAGTYKYEYEDYYGDIESEKINIFDDSDDEWGEGTPKRFQAGLNLGVGFSYKALYLGVGYVADFTKIFDYEDLEGKIGVTTLTLGINF